MSQLREDASKKTKASARLSFVPAFTLVYKIILHRNMKVLATKMMFFKRLSGMWTVRYTERLTQLADYISHERFQTH